MSFEIIVASANEIADAKTVLLDKVIANHLLATEFIVSVIKGIGFLVRVKTEKPLPRL